MKYIPTKVWLDITRCRWVLFGSGGLLLSLAGSGEICLALACSCWLGLDFPGFGWIWLAVAWSDWLVVVWSALGLAIIQDAGKGEKSEGARPGQEASS